MSSPDPKSRLHDLVSEVVLKAYPSLGDVQIEIERPKNSEHGDFTTNVALQLAKRVGKKPREVAETITKGFVDVAGDAILPSIAGPGFINFKLPAQTRFAFVPQVLRQGAAWGRSDAHRGEKIMV